MHNRCRAPSHDQTAIRSAREAGDRALDRGCITNVDRAHLYPERRCHRLHRTKLTGSKGEVGIAKDRHLLHARRDFLEKLQPFCADAILESDKAGGVAARARQAIDKAGTNRIGRYCKHDRYRARRLQQRSRCGAAICEDDVRCEGCQFPSVSVKLRSVGCGPPRVEAHIAADIPAQERQRLHECSEADLKFRIVRGSRKQHTDAPHPLALLRPRRERPRCRRAAEQPDELPPPHAGHGLPPRCRRLIIAARNRRAQAV